MEEKVLAIINLIREHKGMESLNEISINCLLRDDLGFTSFDLAELTVRIEDEFDIDIFEDGIVSTVGDILNKLK
ncbi:MULTISPECIES: phosphopantetheine-binding protein [Butyricimonas]|uniref:phosphopantetheine-binding protein n=1 Tax=Butyricimonas TaxID=574697 RepID=UPI0022E22BE8|nr:MULTISPECIES: phosphopantetheine-binding protein [Butyricimonas]